MALPRGSPSSVPCFAPWSSSAGRLERLCRVLILAGPTLPTLPPALWPFCWPSPLCAFRHGRLPATAILIHHPPPSPTCPTSPNRSSPPTQSAQHTHHPACTQPAQPSPASTLRSLHFLSFYLVSCIVHTSQSSSRRTSQRRHRLLPPRPRRHRHRRLSSPSSTRSRHPVTAYRLAATLFPLPPFLLPPSFFLRAFSLRSTPAHGSTFLSTANL